MERRTNLIEVLADGQMQVREQEIITDTEGNEHVIGFHRRVIEVGQDVSSEDDLIKSVADAVHTPERVAARRQYYRPVRILLLTSFLLSGCGQQL